MFANGFPGNLAVVTGGGSGIGRELVRQLAAAGCHVATCDLSAPALDETRALALEGAPAATRVHTAVVDVTDRAALERFAAGTAEALDTTHLNVLINNAGVGGGNSFVGDSRDEWDRTFAVCWGGVYETTRAFLPMLLASSEGCVVNISSVNGFWAWLGSNVPMSAYSSAKFAVKGFTEGLIADFATNAPHLRAAVVMPGHVATSILVNTAREHGGKHAVSPAQEARFRQHARLDAAGAAAIILDGIRADRWRILVGDDAEAIDSLVRAQPERAYEPAFIADVRAAIANLTPPPGS